MTHKLSLPKANTTDDTQAMNEYNNTDEYPTLEATHALGVGIYLCNAAQIGKIGLRRRIGTYS